MATSQLPDRLACYVHPDHLTGAHCTRCGRPICPTCLVEAPYGHHCPTCVEERASEGKGPSLLRRVLRLGGHRRLTPVVGTLIAVNVVVFVLTSRHPAWKADYAQIPYWVAHGQAYRLLTATFVHENLAHIGFNMAALLIMGPPVEQALGFKRFLALYLVAALGGSVLSFLLGPVFVPGVGASGAIFGIFGAWFSLARAQRADTGVILLLIAINLGYSFYDPNIDWRAHVGGLVAGVLMGAVYAWAVGRLPRARVAYETAVVLGLLASLGAMVLVRSAQI